MLRFTRRTRARAGSIVQRKKRDLTQPGKNETKSARKTSLYRLKKGEIKRFRVMRSIAIGLRSLSLICQRSNYRFHLTSSFFFSCCSIVLLCFYIFLLLLFFDRFDRSSSFRLTFWKVSKSWLDQKHFQHIGRFWQFGWGHENAAVAPFLLHFNLIAHLTVFFSESS